MLLLIEMWSRILLPWDVENWNGLIVGLDITPPCITEFIGCGQVEFVRIVLVNANDDGLCTPPAELKCMDATASASICMVNARFGFIWIFIYFT
ncbi:hypothetical protein FQA39_LY07098 [Lamprigera yunnana]|nr:hypothetical protein FQA39_LY07098 [Lamprigera yunnana]